MSATHEAVIQHLLFHKSIVDDDDDASRYNEYLTMIEAGHHGDHLVMRDPFDKTVALCFQLVLEQHMDPWNIDLARFARLYVDRLREIPAIDLVGAGRLILMAWNILKLQSDEVVREAEIERTRVEEEQFSWDSFDQPDWMTDDADYSFTQAVLGSPDAPIDEKVRHRGDRKVTLMELVAALEEARVEAEEFRIVSERRTEERERWKRESKQNFRGRMHDEDLASEIALTWGRINTFNGHPIPLSDLHDGSHDDFLRILVSVLFLSRDGFTEVSQLDFPHGDILVKNLAPGAPLKAARGKGGDVQLAIEDAEPEPGSRNPEAGTDAAPAQEVGTR